MYIANNLLDDEQEHQEEEETEENKEEPQKQLQMVMRLGTCRHLQIANTAHHCSHHQTLVFTIGNLGIMDTNLMLDNELVVDEELVKPLTVDNIFEVDNIFKVDNNLAIEVDKSSHWTS